MNEQLNNKDLMTEEDKVEAVAKLIEDSEELNKPHLVANMLDEAADSKRRPANLGPLLKTAARLMRAMVSDLVESDELIREEGEILECIDPLGLPEDLSLAEKIRRIVTELQLSANAGRMLEREGQLLRELCNAKETIINTMAARQQELAERLNVPSRAN